MHFLYVYINHRFRQNHRSMTHKYLSPTAPSCIDEYLKEYHSPLSSILIGPNNLHKNNLGTHQLVTDRPVLGPASKFLLNSKHGFHHSWRVSCQKGSICHTLAWRVGPFWQDTIELFAHNWLGLVRVVKVFPFIFFHEPPLAFHVRD